MKKTPRGHDRLMNNLWATFWAAGLATSILLPPALIAAGWTCTAVITMRERWPQLIMPGYLYKQ